MNICQQCGTENRSGSRYCAKCGASLLPLTSTDSTQAGSGSSAITRPIHGIKQEQGGDPSTQSPAEAKANNILPSQDAPDTQLIQSRPAFNTRPPGAIFQDQFLCQALIFSNDQQNRYSVTQFGVPETSQIRACSVPTCGAIHSHQTEQVLQYCTACGGAISSDMLLLALVESRTPNVDHLAEIINLGLAHGSVRAPLAIFDEEFASEKRYCLVIPMFDHQVDRPEPSMVLKWGLELANGLEYLHDNGVSFQGKIDETRFGLVGDRPVWVNFDLCTTGQDVSASDRMADTRALAGQLLQWLTGKTQWTPDTNLLPPLKGLFEQVFSSSSIGTAQDLAQAIEKAHQESSNPSKAVDHRVGHLTNVGMARKLNEDSMLVIASDCVQQSIHKPIGVFVVADGMGGHAAGEVASGAIVSTIAQKSYQYLKDNVSGDHTQWLKETINSANEVVFNMRTAAGTDMGSTLVMALIDGNQAFIGHAGDSRIYLINSHLIRQLTTDHSLVERLVATGQIKREEARTHPQRNVVYRTLGDKPRIEVDTSSLGLDIGDRLLLCSDGLSGMVEDQWIQKVVIESHTAQEACEKLIQAANLAGGDDNITAILVQIVQP